MKITIETDNLNKLKSIMEEINDINNGTKKTKEEVNIEIDGSKIVKPIVCSVEKEKNIITLFENNHNVETLRLESNWNIGFSYSEGVPNYFIVDKLMEECSANYNTIYINFLENLRNLNSNTKIEQFIEQLISLNKQILIINIENPHPIYNNEIQNIREVCKKYNILTITMYKNYSRVKSFYYFRTENMHYNFSVFYHPSYKKIIGKCILNRHFRIDPTKNDFIFYIK